MDVQRRDKSYWVLVLIVHAECTVHRRAVHLGLHLYPAQPHLPVLQQLEFAGGQRHLLRVWGGLQLHLLSYKLCFHLPLWPVPLWLRGHPRQPGLVRFLHQLNQAGWGGI